MYRQLATTLPNGAITLFDLPPIQADAMLELAWAQRKNVLSGNPGPPDPGHPDRRSTLSASIPSIAVPAVGGVTARVAAPRNVQWDHLIYAYMIENTRIYEIFERVIQQYVSGEQLGVPGIGSEGWLRNTEELFYKNPAPLAIRSVVSHTRPDLRATRRNAYFRMFGMDLNHGKEDKEPYPFHKAKAYNGEFVETFEEFLREVWVGITHENNQTGVNPTDNAAISNLVDRIHNMLLARRVNGTLSREEFYAVSKMAWFHLTLESDTPIVRSLSAEATSPEQRLFKIAERVGLPAHGQARSFFELADPMSRLLTLIETGAVNTAAAAPSFYRSNGGANQLQADMHTIITQWSIVAGRDMKTRKVQVVN